MYLLPMEVSGLELVMVYLGLLIKQITISGFFRTMSEGTYGNADYISTSHFGDESVLQYHHVRADVKC